MMGDGELIITKLATKFSVPSYMLSLNSGTIMDTGLLTSITVKKTGIGWLTKSVLSVI